MNFPKSDNLLLNVAGVVGVGKSSLTDILAQEDYKVFYEPVVDNTLLEKFYADKKKYALAMQIFFLNKRFAMYKEAILHPKASLDRSIVEDKIFAKMLNDQGQIEDFEYNLYIELFENMVEHIKVPDLMIYLRINPENAIKRIQQRGRDYEIAQDPAYWFDLNMRYEAFFKEYNWSKLLTIDVDDMDFVNIPDDKERIMNIINTEIQSIMERPQLERHHNGKVLMPQEGLNITPELTIESRRY